MANPVASANTTYAWIEKKVRRLTASASQSALPSADIEDAVNRFYSQDFPSSIKTDQMRSVYKFLTIPNVDRYPVDPNSQQSFRGPVYVEGFRANLFKNRDQLFNIFPRSPTKFLPASGDGVTTVFSFSLIANSSNLFPSPNLGILSTQVIIGGIDVNGNPIRIIDDGGSVANSFGIGSNTTTGQLLFLNSNTVGANIYLDGSNVQQPAIPDLSPLAPSGESSPPSTLTSQYCGTVNYVTTQIDVTFPVAPADGTQINVWANTYNPGRPNNILWWNNEITLRPVPDNIYLVECEVYQSPVQFMKTNDSPKLNDWGQYIAYGAAMEILRERQDMEGVANLQAGFNDQEAQILEQQANEEIFSPNITMFNSTGLGLGFCNDYWGF